MSISFAIVVAGAVVGIAVGGGGCEVACKIAVFSFLMTSACLFLWLSALFQSILLSQLTISLLHSVSLPLVLLVPLDFSVSLAAVLLVGFAVLIAAFCLFLGCTKRKCSLLSWAWCSLVLHITVVFLGISP
jgi:hypothetical protein